MSIATETDREVRLTYSRLACAKTCLRKHQILYELALRPDAEATSLRVGRMFHRGMEAVSLDAALQEVTDTYGTAIIGTTDEIQNQLRVEYQMVSRLVAAHDWRWQAMDAEMEVISTEQAFEIPLVNPDTGMPSRTWTLAGKRDKIVRLPDGRLAILEYKVTSDDISPESDYWKRLRVDSQVSIYWLAAIDAGIKVETVLYDVTRKPSIAPRQIPVLDSEGNKVVMDESGARVFNKDGSPRQSADSAKGWRLLTETESPEVFGQRFSADIADRPDFYFARREVARTEADLDEARYELWQWAQILRDCERNNRWPRNTGACVGFGKCACWDLCMGGFDCASGIVPEGWRKVENVHQELNGD